VIYQPVSIEPREIVPRIVRDESYGKGADGLDSNQNGSYYVRLLGSLRSVRMAEIRNYTMNFGRSIRPRTACCVWCWNLTAR